MPSRKASPPAAKKPRRKPVKRRKKRVEPPRFSIDLSKPAPANPPGYIFVGIDPGKTGAISTLLPDGRVVARPTPTVKINGQDVYDAYKMHRYMRWLRLWAISGKMVHIVMEEVTMRPFEAKRTVLAMGAGQGYWLCLARLYGFQITEVHPATWKAAYKFSKGRKTTAEFKRDSIKLCGKLYPQLSLQLQKDEAMAEATLLADYLKRSVIS